jgi:STIMATE family
MIGALELHFANIFLSDIASSLGADSLEPHPNPCVWYAPSLFGLMERYFLNLFVDCTIGVPILWVNLKILHRICRYLRLKGTRSGDYGGPPYKWKWWLKQVVVYCIGVCWMKIGTLIVLGSLPYLDKVGEWLIGWTKGSTTLQIIFVMFVRPSEEF